MQYYYRKSWIKLLVSIFDWFGSISFGFARFLLRKSGESVPPFVQNILLIRLDHLGDVLYVKPAVAAIRHKYPQAKITLLLGSKSKALVEHDLAIDEIMVFDAPWFQRGAHKTSWVAVWELLRKIRSRNFDLSIDFKGYLWHILIMYFAGIRNRVSYDDVGGQFLLSSAVRRRLDLPAVEQNFHLLSAIGILTPPTPRVQIEIPRENQVSLENLLKQNNLSGGNIIAVHVGAGRTAKRWPIEKFGKLFTQMSADFPEYKVVLVGGNEEAALCEPLVKANKKLFSLIGKLGLLELAEFLGKCDLFIGNDSAPAHFAAVMGTPVIVLFSCEDDPVQWRPYGRRVDIVQAEPFRFVSVTTEEVMTSMNKIAVKNVLEYVAHALRSLKISNEQY